MVTFGKNIQALAVCYNIVQCIPYGRLQSVLKPIFGIGMSRGTVSNIIRQAKKKAGPAIALIKKYIGNPPVAGFDGSGCCCDKRPDWSWIARTAHHTLVFRAGTRPGKEPGDMFGNALENMRAVTGRHPACFALDFINRQICPAHILREVQYLNELDGKQQWPVNLQTLLREAIRERNQNPDKIIDPSSWLICLDNILKRSVEHLNDDFRRLKKRIGKI